MTQEDKQLLLKDLCARLSYQPLCKKVDTEDDFCECDAPLGYSLRDLADNKIIIKPYLRPMSSMTKEETKELFKEIGFEFTCNTCGIPAHYNYEFAEQIKGIPTITNVEFIKVIDWLNAKHFDYRGLIEKGLALEAPEGMYK